MGATDAPEPQSAWLWPAEWAVERAFWREVGTRTVAGVLTILIVGVPTLVWAAISGALRWETVAPVVIGFAMFGLLVVIYVAVIVGIRRRERKKIEAALALENYIAEILPDPKMLSSLDASQRAKLMESISDAGRAKLADATRLARTQATISAVALLAAVIAAFIGMLQFPEWGTEFVRGLLPDILDPRPTP